MTRRVLLCIVVALGCLGITVPALAAPEPTVPAASQKAGNISALLPVANIVRGAGKDPATTEAKKGDELIWNDLVQTQKGGRARITLVDQSILSVGSQSELRILKHDARSRQTALQLTYGRVRAEVTSMTRDGGRFEVRTPTAVAGVIGTDFGATTGLDDTEFICISGTVSISNSDPSVTGSVFCAPGQTTTVAKGKAPSAPKPASAEQINRLIHDTEPAIITAFAPAAALQGAALDAVVSGARLEGIKTVAVSGNGVQVSLNDGGTATSASVHIVVDANAAAGPRTITLAKASGPSAATLFTIFEKPTAGGASDDDIKAPYRAIIRQEQGVLKASISAVPGGVQQLADLAYQELDAANRDLPEPLDLEPASTELSAPVDRVSNFVSPAPGQVDDAATAALNELDSVFTALKSDLLQRDPKGVPDDSFTAALKREFLRINGNFLQSFVQVNTGATLQNASTEIARVRDDWMAKIREALAAQAVDEEDKSNDGLRAGADGAGESAGVALAGGGVPPTPRADRSDVNVAYGAPISLDASSSSAGSAAIAAYQWAVCDSSYKPGQACNAVGGLISTEAQFNLNACALPAGNYTAQLVVTDINGLSAALDVPINVARDDTDNPAQRLLDLASAYSSLQLNEFMQYFDPLEYPAYATLQENMRTTLASLSSMQVQVLNAQPTITCNDATMQTAWSQNYSFKSNPTVLLSTDRPKPLTVTFKRNPGVGWFITNFQGDDGTVQGAAVIIPTSAADIAVESVAVSSTMTGGLTAGRPAALTVLLKNYGSAASTAGGILTITGDSTLQLTGVTAPIPPLSPGASVAVEVSFTMPLTASGPHYFTATITTRVPGDESLQNETKTSAALPIAAGFPNYTITDIRYYNSTTSALHQDASGNVAGNFAIVVGEWVDVVVTVANTDPNHSPVNDLTVTYNCGAPACSNGGAGNNLSMVVAAPAANSSVNVPFVMLNFSGPPGQYRATATVAAGVQESNVGDNSLTKPWDLFDWQFQFSTPSGGPTFPVSPELNIPAGGSGQLPISVSETGVLAGDIRNVDLTIVMDPPTANASFSYAPSMAPGVQNVSVNAGNSANGTATVYVDSWAWRVAKEVQQSVRFYNASLQNITDPANSSSTPLAVTRGGTTTITLQYNSNLPPNSAATLDTATPMPTGFSLGYTGGDISGGQFQISIITDALAPSTVTALPIRLKIPNTYPAQFVATTIYVLAAAANLTVTSPAPDPTIPRDFTTAPWAAGQPAYFVVNVANLGNAVALGPVVVTLSLNGTIVGSATAPDIAAGSNADVAITAVAPNTALSGPQALTASVTCASVDIDPTNNVSSPFMVPVADWRLVITSPNGTSTSPLKLDVTNGFSAPVEIALQFVNSSGTRYPLITLASPNQSSNVLVDFGSDAILGGAMYGNTKTITATVPASAPSGEYFFQVLGGLNSILHGMIFRQVTVHVIVGSGAPLDTVAIISDRNNAGPLNSTPTPVQINGLLPESLSLQATRALCSPPPASCGGFVDLLFSDDPAVLSNVVGTNDYFMQDTPLIANERFNTPRTVMFAAATNDADQITPGPAQVIISATGIQTGVVAGNIRAYPIPDPVGTQQTLLAFNIGDINITVPACINVPPNAANVPVDISWDPVHSFNASQLNWAWAALPSGIAADSLSGTSTLQQVVTTSLTNSNTADVAGVQNASFQVSITNGSNTATKTFTVGINMATGACPVMARAGGGRRAATGVASGSMRLSGSWRKGGGNTAITARAVMPSVLPDLRISAPDISYTPSLPKPGDRIAFRFRVSNSGDANAVKVPIALRVNGTVIASDTFDVGAGKSTLAGLEWANAQAPAAHTILRRGALRGDDTPLTVELLVDPAATTRQKTTIGKSAILPRFSLRGPLSPVDGGARERIVLEVAEGGCAGLRFNGGPTSGCTGVDVELSVEDLASAHYTFTAPTGIADLGYMNIGASDGRRARRPRVDTPMFAQKATVVVGHSYAVQMKDNQAATITVQAIRSAQQVEAKTAKVFDKGVGRRSRSRSPMGRLGGHTAPVETGDVAPSPRTDAKITFELLYETP